MTTEKQDEAEPKIERKPMVTTAALITGHAIATELAKRVVADVYDLAKEYTKNTIKRWDFEKKAQKLYTQVHKVRLVKTLWQVDKSVDLKQFYCDQHVLIENKRRRISKLEDIGNRKNILIQGIAGQGKSIFLRFLCGQCLSTGKVLPVFIELRRILQGETILNHVSRYFSILGLDLPDTYATRLAKAGRIALFLDGFDEVPEGDKLRMLNEIEFLAESCDSLRIIVTSRPDSGFEMSAHFEVLRLDNLREAEYKTVVHKLTDGDQMSEALIRQIENHKGSIKELLCTPLMVTLLVMSYKSFQELPSQLSGFYESLFQVLLQRHDGVKPGYKRSRKCSMNDSEYRHAFEALCYETKRVQRSMLTREQVIRAASAALKTRKSKDDSEEFIKDIVCVTCLLLKDGVEYRFIHKSVQEYYTASYIRHKADPVAQKFYTSLQVNDETFAWNQELRFLSEIDTYRYSKYYLLPFCLKVLGITEAMLDDNIPRITLAHMSIMFDNASVCLSKESGGGLRVNFVRINRFFVSNAAHTMFNLDYAPALTVLGEDKISKTDTSSPRDEFVLAGEFLLKVNTLLDAGLMHAEFGEIGQAILDSMHADARRAKECVDHEEEAEIDLPI